MNRRRSSVLLCAALLVSSGALVSVMWRSAALDLFTGPAGPTADPFLYIDTLLGPAGAVTILPAKPGEPSGYTRIAPLAVPDGPRRVGIQAGHWMTDAVPAELRRLEDQTGASFAGYDEVDINVDIAERVATLLRGEGLVVDVLPTAIPAGYVADAFVALHADSDGVGDKSGFKIAHSVRRGPYEDRLQSDLTAEYAAATGLAYDSTGITRNMTNYFALNWARFRSATSPFTPSVILEMGYISNDGDRSVMIDRADTVARGIANGILRFLSEVPSSDIFGKDLVLPPVRAFPIPIVTATPTPGP
ncbi:MAG TPA: N-acetylmuramoyl-L-alanine amidase [Candidatus Limnocylindria bacterium]|nr:N-acetylmuramoyl-L-alanine amidase [Candidatus Limnocylindria bacterium]